VPGSSSEDDRVLDPGLVQHEVLPGSAEQTWKDAPHEPFGPLPSGAQPTYEYLRPHEAAYAPIGAGRQLDEWAKERGQGEYAITGGLPTLFLLDEMNQVLSAVGACLDVHAAVPEQEARLLGR
jgi:hypothetical protein